MQWYYAIRGESSKHGLVDEKTLFQMARDGTLKPTDLVWDNRAADGWVAAGALAWLFPRTAGPARPRPPRALHWRGKPVEPRLIVGIILAEALLCAALGVVVWLQWP